jgi:hypothetical protein
MRCIQPLRTLAGARNRGPGDSGRHLYIPVYTGPRRQRPETVALISYRRTGASGRPGQGRASATWQTPRPASPGGGRLLQRLGREPPVAGPPGVSVMHKPPGWNKHPPLLVRHVTGPVYQVRTVVVGGMPGWQIALIAAGAALVAATGAATPPQPRTPPHGPTTASATSPGSGSGASPFSAVSSTNTSEQHRSPGQDRWTSSGTPQGALADLR